MAFVVVDSKTVTIAVVAAVAPKGSITEVKFWNLDTLRFEPTVPKIVQGQNIGIQVWCRNDATVSQTMRVDVTVTDPMGVVSKQNNTTTAPLAPGAAIAFLFSWSAERAGTYKVDLVLSVV